MSLPAPAFARHHRLYPRQQWSRYLHRRKRWLQKRPRGQVDSISARTSVDKARLAWVEATMLTESSPSPPLIVVLIAETASKSTVSLPAPPATKPELTSLVAEKETLSTPALPASLKSVAEVAETVTKTVSLLPPPLSSEPLN